MAITKQRITIHFQRTESFQNKTRNAIHHLRFTFLSLSLRFQSICMLQAFPSYTSIKESKARTLT